MPLSQADKDEINRRVQSRMDHEGHPGGPQLLLEESLAFFVERIEARLDRLERAEKP